MRRMILLVQIVASLLSAHIFMVMTVVKCRTDVSTDLCLIANIILFMFVFYKQSEEYIDEYY